MFRYLDRKQIIWNYVHMRLHAEKDNEIQMFDNSLFTCQHIPMIHGLLKCHHYHQVNKLVGIQ